MQHTQQVKLDCQQQKAGDQTETGWQKAPEDLTQNSYWGSLLEMDSGERREDASPPSKANPILTGQVRRSAQAHNYQHPSQSTRTVAGRGHRSDNLPGLFEPPENIYELSGRAIKWDETAREQTLHLQRTNPVLLKASLRHWILAAMAQASPQGD